MLALELIQKDKITETPGQAGSEAQTVESISPDQAEEQLQQLKKTSRELELVLAELTNASAEQLDKRRQSLQDSIEKLRLQRAADSDIAPTDAADRPSTEAMEGEIEELRKELEALKSAKRVIYNKDPTTSKDGWVVDVGATTISIARLDGGMQKATISAPADELGLARIVKWARSHDNAKEYFVLSVRPGAIAQFITLRDQLDDLGFDLGFDVVGGDAVVVKAGP
ncbi:hypothetical protein [Botrimarina colliarenosi]|nr:hypothetical protein [Botrimarina colliarenosi]